MNAISMILHEMFAAFVCFQYIDPFQIAPFCDRVSWGGLLLELPLLQLLQ